MNTRIKQLFDTALDRAVPETWTTLSHEQVTKLSQVLAELVVLECAVIVGSMEEPHQDIAELIKQHFGVEQ